jgi:hypothetical protein
MSRGPGILQREVLRRASARRKPFTARDMASKLYPVLDQVKLVAVHRALRGLASMGYLIKAGHEYSRTPKPLSKCREWTTPLEMVRIDFDEADKLLGDGNHYLGPAGWRRGYALTTPTRDAVAVFRPPTASHFNKTLDCPLELSRLWRADDSPWPLTQFLGKALKWIKREAPETSCVFSYSDPNAINPQTGQPHVGGIYTASNFAFIGTSDGSGHWLNERGERVSQSYCYDRFGTRSTAKVAALNPSWKFVAGERKSLFVFPMRLSVAAVLAAIGGDGKRYSPGPKPDGGHYSPQWRVKIKADLGDMY